MLQLVWAVYSHYFYKDEFVKEEYVVRVEVGKYKMEGPSLCLENSI